VVAVIEYLRVGASWLNDHYDACPGF
jgi:hypothetical protein